MSKTSTSSAKATHPKIWKTAIAKATPAGVFVRGYDVIEDLTGTMGPRAGFHLDIAFCRLFAYRVGEVVRESGWHQIPLGQIYYDGLVRIAT